VIVSHRYEGRSGIANGLSSAHVAFATDTFREPTFFRGTIGGPVIFREALAALYEVVVSDFKYRPKDRLEYKAWLEEQDRKFLASLGLRRKNIIDRAEQLQASLGELDRARLDRLKPFHRARLAYFDYAYLNWFERSLILDPVVTVHPDEISFEAFSRDESTYARLAAAHEAFDRVDEFECGTTNIDFSTRLHHELQRIRSYRTTRLDVGPSGLAVATEGSDGHSEKKVDLPDSWVLGFLQVHSAMSLGLTRLRMAPVDLFNICRFLRRRKAKSSPRALRFELEPDRPARVVFEPWEHAIELSPVATFEGPKPVVVRTWGRDRLRTLARLIPACQSVDVYLAGLGLPSIYVLHLGPLRFTLALSGWTDNDWTSSASKFDLLARRLDVSTDELSRAYESMRLLRLATDSGLACRAGFGVEKARSALSFLCQVGRAMYDLGGGVYRHRDLFLDPFSPEEAVKSAPVGAASIEGQAQAIADSPGGIRVIARRPVSTGYKLSGSASDQGGRRVRPLLHVDHDGRIIEGSCTCRWSSRHGMTKGPCEHLLALRLAHMERLEQEDTPDA
jgi:hypothetical protein